MKSAKTLLAAAAVTLMLGPVAALAETLQFSAILTGSDEVPPNDSAGTGTLEATFDTETMLLRWTVNYEGLTGPAGAAHFHGPANVGENAGPVVPITGDLASPIQGEATLTNDQATALQQGLLYFNIHTAQFGGGEIRGQVVHAEMAM